MPINREARPKLRARQLCTLYESPPANINTLLAKLFTAYSLLREVRRIGIDPLKQKVTWVRGLLEPVEFIRLITKVNMFAKIHALWDGMQKYLKRCQEFTRLKLRSQLGTQSFAQKIASALN